MVRSKMALNDPTPENELPAVAAEVKGQNSGTFRDVQYESLTQFAWRNNVPIDAVRRMNPNSIDDNGNITAPSLKVSE